jgi:hypothetical protein
VLRRSLQRGEKRVKGGSALPAAGDERASQRTPWRSIIWINRADCYFRERVIGTEP